MDFLRRFAIQSLYLGSKLFNGWSLRFLIVLFALLQKISSIVYKKGCSMSASNKLTFSFP